MPEDVLYVSVTFLFAPLYCSCLLVLGFSLVDVKLYRFCESAYLNEFLVMPLCIERALHVNSVPGISLKAAESFSFLMF